MSYHVHNTPVVPKPDNPYKPRPLAPDPELDRLKKDAIEALNYYIKKALDLDNIEGKVINIDGSVLALEATTAKAHALAQAREDILKKIETTQPDLSGVAKQGDNPDATNTAILAAIPTECSNEDIDRMFEATSEDGRIIVPSGLITPEGTMPISVFKAITGLTPTE